ncbi:fucose synthetase [Leptospira interrogans]|uniref:fucose synthetase n=1 Tax=Leptospira interrogans TaxID=173 RepID=UPI00051449C9|nr:fucose synthetase [Leptospira interrogans]KGE25980.1 fucose synthetase [Leptospira interrogans serovar Lai]
MSSCEFGDVWLHKIFYKFLENSVENIGGGISFTSQDWSSTKAREHVKIGSRIETSICELAETVKEVEGFRYFDFRSDEIPRKLLDVSKLHRMGWKYQVK